MNQSFHLALLLVLILGLASCQTEKDEARPDISQIEVDINIHRFEQALFTLKDLPEDLLAEELQTVKESYPGFYDFYFDELMSIGNGGPSDLPKKKAFIADENLGELVNSVRKEFPELKELNADLELAFRYFKNYFPDREIPKIISYIGGFGPAAITLDDEILAVNLDLHLGADYEYYKAYDFPKYQQVRFSRAYLIVNLMKVYIRELLPPARQSEKLIDVMVRNGVELYLLDKLLPDVPDALKTGYTESQVEWCDNNESNIWAFFLERELLFDNNAREYRRYITDGPTTAGMPSDSPANIASWLGWQIVKRYMELNKEVGVKDLLNVEGGEMFLKKSRYKPRS